MALPAEVSALPLYRCCELDELFLDLGHSDRSIKRPISWVLQNQACNPMS